MYTKHAILISPSVITHNKLSKIVIHMSVNDAEGRAEFQPAPKSKEVSPQCVGRNVDVSNGVVFSTRTVRVKFINVKNSSGWISRWLGDFHRIVEAFPFQGVGDGRFVRRVCAFTFR